MCWSELRESFRRNDACKEFDQKQDCCWVSGVIDLKYTFVEYFCFHCLMDSAG